jgi:hypothetical protein
MARRPLTERQQQLRLAHQQLALERKLLREQQARVRAAKRDLDALGRCDWCGAQTFPYAAEVLLCDDCGKERNERNRIKLLAAHGYGPDGQRLPRADRAAA